jgi:hypothetical protein
MKSLLWGTYPMLKLFNLIGDVQEFESWLKKEHQKQMDSIVLHGYKFFLECTFSNVLENLHSDSTLEIKNDFLIDAVGREAVYLGKLPNTCEKIIFLKNIYFHFRPIQRAKNKEELINAIQEFRENVISPFEVVFNNSIKIKRHRKLSKEQIHTLFLIEKVYLFFNQINNNGPFAYSGTLMKQYWITDEKLKICFEGYKYAVQFAWYKLLGSKKYNSSCLREIHKTESWRGYIYNEEVDDNDLASHLNRTFDIYKQTSFDAFFYKIREEIIYPLEKKNAVEITQMEDFFICKKQDYSKRVFRSLLNKKNAIEEKQTIEERLDMLLYWYPVEIIDSVMHNSIPAFITMLTGTVGLLQKKEKELNRAIVCKFIHPKDKNSNQNDYSYGILIDAKAAAGHYSSGWLLYYDCCGDYSGFSGSEHQRVESIIKRLTKQGKLELREYKIPHHEFKEYIAKYIREKSENLDVEAQVSEGEIVNKMTEISEKKKKKSIITDSQGLLLELISYYISTKKKAYSTYKEIKWNTSVKAGQIDIVMENDTDVHIIECKLNPHTLNFDKEIDKLQKKLDQSQKHGKRTFEFWFWHEPNEPTKKSLAEKRVQYFSLSKNSHYFPASLKAVLNHQINL